MGSAAHVGQFLVGAFAFAPLVMLSLVIGLTWNWKRWLIAAAIFHIIFAFFFTSVFTNIAGLGTGMIYSLGYWLEQQGVRRGSQPQYYYLLIILPTYEFPAHRRQRQRDVRRRDLLLEIAPRAHNCGRANSRRWDACRRGSSA